MQQRGNSETLQQQWSKARGKDMRQHLTYTSVVWYLSGSSQGSGLRATDNTPGMALRGPHLISRGVPSAVGTDNNKQGEAFLFASDTCGGVYCLLWYHPK